MHECELAAVHGNSSKRNAIFVYALKRWAVDSPAVFRIMYLLRLSARGTQYHATVAFVRIQCNSPTGIVQWKCKMRYVIYSLQINFITLK